MDALGINIGYLLMQIFGLTLLIILLNTFAYKPILKTLEARKEKIAKGLEDARQAAIARDSADADAKKILDEARAEAAKIRAEAVASAEEQAKGILASANEEAKTIKVNATTDAEEERNNILASTRGQIASIAIAAANKLVGESLDEKRQRVLVSDFFSKVSANVAGMTGDKAEVTSALPLTDEEKANIKQSLKVENITYKVNPNILGGLIVRVGDKVVDNSVSSQMTAMRDSLK